MRGRIFSFALIVACACSRVIAQSNPPTLSVVSAVPPASGVAPDLVNDVDPPPMLRGHAFTRAASPAIGGWIPLPGFSQVATAEDSAGMWRAVIPMSEHTSSIPRLVPFGAATSAMVIRIHPNGDYADVYPPGGGSVRLFAAPSNDAWRYFYLASRLGQTPHAETIGYRFSGQSGPTSWIIAAQGAWSPVVPQQQPATAPSDPPDPDAPPPDSVSDGSPGGFMMWDIRDRIAAPQSRIDVPANGGSVYSVYDAESSWASIRAAFGVPNFQLDYGLGSPDDFIHAVWEARDEWESWSPAPEVVRTICSCLLVWWAVRFGVAMASWAIGLTRS